MTWTPTTESNGLCHCPTPGDCDEDQSCTNTGQFAIEIIAGDCDDYRAEPSAGAQGEDWSETCVDNEGSGPDKMTADVSVTSCETDSSNKAKKVSFWDSHCGQGGNAQWFVQCKLWCVDCRSLHSHCQ